MKFHDSDMHDNSFVTVAAEIERFGPALVLQNLLDTYFGASMFSAFLYSIIFLNMDLVLEKSHQSSWSNMFSSQNIKQLLQLKVEVLIQPFCKLRIQFQPLSMFHALLGEKKKKKV